MAARIASRLSWNPLRCGGTALPTNLLLLAKLIALAFLITNHVRILPEPFLSFVPALDNLPGPLVKTVVQVLFVTAGLALLFNRRPRVSALVMGSAVLFSVVVSKAYYGNNKTLCGLLLVMTGLWHERIGVALYRAQVIILYLGAGINKLLDPDWQSGQFFHHWASARLQNPIYQWAAQLLPPLMLAKFFCYQTIVVELGLGVLFAIRRAWPVAIWVSLLFHAALLEFTGSTFTMFFYGMEAAMLAFVVWPRNLIVIWDGECGICAKIKNWMSRVDFEGAFHWRTLQSGIGDRWGIPRYKLEQSMHLVADTRVSSGFRACKLILLYNPAFYLVVCALIAGIDSVWFRRIFVGALLAFFFPWFNFIGEAAYNWVARNRYRFSSQGACAVEPR